MSSRSRLGAFLKFVANKGLNDEAANYSFVLRGYVRHWLANVVERIRPHQADRSRQFRQSGPRISGEK